MKQLTGRKGFTLLELLIVAPMMVLASIIAFTMIFRAWQGYKYALAQTDASYQAVNNLDRISRVLKSTNKVLSATDNDLTVETYFSPRDSVPDHARYYLQSGALYVDVIPATGTAPNYTYLTTNKQTTKLATVLNTATDPLFRYYNESGSLLPSPIDIAAVREIEILVVTNPDKHTLHVDQRALTRIQLRNMKTNL